MDSIKYTAKGHSVEFSKRTLTIDNKVYSYTGISQVKHSAAYQAYLFRYKGEWVKLFYDEPHGDVVAALFRKINTMNARRAAKARATQSIDTSAIAAALAAAAGEAPAPEVKEEPKAEPEPAVITPVEPPKPEVPAAEPEPAVVAPVEPEPEIVEPVVEPAVVEPVVEPAVVEPAEVPAEEPAEAPAEEPKAEEPAEVPAEEEPEEEEEEEEAPAKEEPAEEEPQDAEAAILAKAEEAAIKRAKRKKAFIIFAIILALFIIAGIIYFLTVGTTNDAAQSPNVDETHQYNDIDELIEEMQE